MERRKSNGNTGESPLRALYHRWTAAKDAHNISCLDDDEPREIAIFDTILEIEQQAADFEPQTMEDLLFKIIFADDDGDMKANIHQEALVARAYEMVGIERRGPEAEAV